MKLCVKYFVVAFVSIFMFFNCSRDKRQIFLAEELPTIEPDYIGVTIPKNIAPLNFSCSGEYDELKVFLSGDKSGSISVRGKVASFPIREWKRLLSNNNTISVTVRKRCGGRWIEYLPFEWILTEDLVDSHICYRRVDPGYEFYSKMGIYQRELSTFRERAIYENNNVAGQCVNCHSFNRGDSKKMQLHLRGNRGGTLVQNGDITTIFDMSNPQTLGSVYPYWHPNGRFITYSVNDIKQTFHNTPDKILDVYDLASDVVVFDIEKGELHQFPILKDSLYLETFPAFSSDGKRLFFCRAARLPEERYNEIRYSLCSIDFDPESCTVGDTITTLFERDGKSVSFPRPSYDGNYIVFTLSDYGCFPIWHKEAQLYIMNLKDGSVRCVDEINSDNTESYHSWSSNSRWMLFSSRRDDGLHTRLYFSHIDSLGNFSKPFILPQKLPIHNERLLQSYNIPEFVKGAVELPIRKITNKNRTKIKVKD